jgi:hypothetical protein
MFMIAVFAILWVVPVLAQESTSPTTGWTVSLYEQTIGKVTRVAPTGEVTAEYSLPMPAEFDTYNYDVAIDDAGSHIAYIVSQVGDASDPVQKSQLVIYDTAASTISGTYDLNPAVIREGINTASISLAFNDAGTRVFMGYYTPVEGAENEWTQEFVVLDTATGQVVNTLTGDMVAGVGANAVAPYRPKVLAFEGDTVTTLLYPIFQQMGADNVVFNWNVASNEVTAGAPDLTNATDFAPASREALVLTYDSEVDALAEGETRVEGMLIPANTVSLLNLDTGASTPIFAQDVSLISAKFVQNGERILLFADAGARGILIERDGTVVTEFQNLPGDMMTSGTQDGFIYADPNQAQTLIAVRTATGDFTPQTLYTPVVPFNMLTVQDYQMPEMGG